MSLPNAQSYETIRLEPEGPLTWIVLNRPEKRNAINPLMLEELTAALGELGSEKSCRVIGIRGEGPSFSSGYDIGPAYTRAVDDRDAIDEWNDLRGRMDRMMAIWDSPLPVIAAVHGYCLAGATQLCTFCDLVIIADDAVVGSPGVGSGAGYVTPMYVLTVGIRRAKELGMIPGRQISGQRAAELGWANWSIGKEKLLDEVRSVAETIALKPRDLVAANKIAINRMAELAGFRFAISQLADIDVIAHRSDSAATVRKQVVAKGPAAVSREFAQERDERIQDLSSSG
jgi:enoyl-CoA hydratase